MAFVGMQPSPMVDKIGLNQRSKEAVSDTHAKSSTRVRFMNNTIQRIAEQYLDNGVIINGYTIVLNQHPVRTSYGKLVGSLLIKCGDETYIVIFETLVPFGGRDGDIINLVTSTTSIRCGGFS